MCRYAAHSHADHVAQYGYVLICQAVATVSTALQLVLQYDAALYIGIVREHNLGPNMQVYQLHKLLEKLTGSEGAAKVLVMPKSTAAAAATPTRSTRPTVPLTVAAGRATVSTLGVSDEAVTGGYAFRLLACVTVYSTHWAIYAPAQVLLRSLFMPGFDSRLCFATLPATKPRGRLGVTCCTSVCFFQIAEDMPASGTAAGSAEDVYTEDFDAATDRASTLSHLPPVAKMQRQRAAEQTGEERTLFVVPDLLACVGCYACFA